MRSRPRLVAERFSMLPSALNTWEISHTEGVVVLVLLCRAREVYARTMQCKAPLPMVVFIKQGVAQSVPVN